jgi:hypothetical protein
MPSNYETFLKSYNKAQGIEDPYTDSIPDQPQQPTHYQTPPLDFKANADYSRAVSKMLKDLLGWTGYSAYEGLDTQGPADPRSFSKMAKAMEEKGQMQRQAQQDQSQQDQK